MDTTSELEAARAGVASARAALHELIDRHGGRHLVPGLETYRASLVYMRLRFFNKEVARLLYQLDKEQAMDKERTMHKCQLCGRRYTESEAVTMLEVTRTLRARLDDCFTITHCRDCDPSDFPSTVRDFDPTKNKEQTDE